MTIKEMSEKIRRKHPGTSIRAARQLISDAAERIEFACDDDPTNYTEDDVLEGVDQLIAEIKED